MAAARWPWPEWATNRYLKQMELEMLRERLREKEIWARRYAAQVEEYRRRLEAMEAELAEEKEEVAR